MGPWAYGVLEGRQVDRWLASRAGWRADVLRDRTNVKSMSLSNVPNTISIFSIYILSITVRTLILRGAYPTAATKHFLTVMCSI